MKSVTLMVFISVVTYTWAQYQPGYAPNGFQYPQPVNNGPSSNNDLENRFGGTAKPQVDENGFSSDQVNKAQNYPEGKKPFWLLNKDAIKAHIGRRPAGTAQAAGASNSASSGDANVSTDKL